MDLHDVISVSPLDDHRLHIEFDDGTAGTVDIAKLIRFRGVFAPLRDLAYFRRAAVHPELGVVCWPNGADLDSDVLYGLLTNTPLPETQTV